MNDNLKINLLVLKSADIEGSVAFYENLFNIDFQRHSHNGGAIHYSADIKGMIFEIYPVNRNKFFIQNHAANIVRFGFQVESISELMKKIKNDAIVISKPKETEWGLIAVIADPDGHRIELNQKKL